MHVTVAVSIFILSIAIAWASLKLYDEPVRQWLKEHWLKAPAIRNKKQADNA